jgi:ABC-type sulfate/molybdate transport systems ATPase subunit
VDPLTVDIAVPLRSFDLRVALEVGGETLAVVGPSGAGKTTLLRAIAGLTAPSKGSIRLGQETWFDGDTNLPPERRSVGLVFQDYALFPHLSVEQNVAYGGSNGVGSLLESFGISHLARERPGRLSGGERQRVALARALARSPRVLLLDEPLAALDTGTRSRVRTELAGLLDEIQLPTLLVTHDEQDAAVLANRTAHLSAGALI